MENYLLVPGASKTALTDLGLALNLLLLDQGSS